MKTRSIVTWSLAAASGLLGPALGLQANEAQSAAVEERAPVTTGPSAHDGGASFVENFAIVSGLRWHVSDGWNNGYHQACTWSRKHVRIPEPGQLQLSLSDVAYKDRASSCAEIQTYAKYGYGTYEVRMQVPAGSGMVTAFFTYNEPSDGDKITNDEIDIEILGKNTRDVQLNYFVSGHGQHESVEPLGLDASTEMADYAFEWLPDRLRWYVNGRLLREVVGSEQRPIPSHPSKIMLSIWSGQGEAMEPWLGPVEDRSKRLTALFSRVAYTKLGEKCAFEGSIVCKNQKTAQSNNQSK